MTLSIIIPAWNEAQVIEDTLHSIIDSDYINSEYELIVVAGGKDGTIEIARKFAKTAPPIGRYLVLEQQPEGKNAAIQQGIKQARNSIVVLLDADTLLSKGVLEKLIHPLVEETADLTIANPFPVRRSWVSEYYMINKEYNLDRISTYSGHVMALRLDLVKDRLDYFFERSAQVGVDYLLAKRLHGEGRRVLFVRQAKVTTWLPSTVKHFFLNDLRWLSAYIALSGFKWRIIGINALMVGAIILLIPLSNWTLALAGAIHAVYFLKKGGVFYEVFSQRKTRLKYLPGFLLLSYAHHLVGLIAHIRYFAFLRSRLTLNQGERPHT